MNNIKREPVESVDVHVVSACLLDSPSVTVANTIKQEHVDPAGVVTAFQLDSQSVIAANSKQEPINSANVVSSCQLDSPSDTVANIKQEHVDSADDVTASPSVLYDTVANIKHGPDDFADDVTASPSVIYDTVANIKQTPVWSQDSTTSRSSIDMRVVKAEQMSSTDARHSISTVSIENVQHKAVCTTGIATERPASIPCCNNMENMKQSMNVKYQKMSTSNSELDKPTVVIENVEHDTCYSRNDAEVTKVELSTSDLMENIEQADPDLITKSKRRRQEDHKLLNEHIVKHQGKSAYSGAGDKYTCAICDATFKRRHRGEDSFVCLICSTMFTDCAFTRHLKAYGNEKGHKCGMSCKSKRGFMIHEKTHSHKQFVCKVCGKEFIQKAKLVSHMRKHARQYAFVCNICNSMFKTKLACDGHVKQHSIDGFHTCEKCDKAFGSASSLNAHIVIHEIFKCGYCRTGFCHQDNLVEHMQSHGKNVFHCTHCKRTFKSKTELESHLEIHKEALVYKCDSCELSFLFKGHLDRHKRCHDSGKSLHLCMFCNTTFATKSSLILHMRIHTGEKPYTCNFCQEAFRTMLLLKEHLPKHTGAKAYRCVKCDATFGDKVELLSHGVIHTGVKPYTCNRCGKTFARAKTLRDHTIIHTGEYQYTCSLCDKSFAVQNTLNIHMSVVHTDEKRYKCEMCGMAFTQSYLLNRHIKMHVNKYGLEACMKWLK